MSGLKSETTYFWAKDLTIFLEEGILISAPQHRKNQCMSSALRIANRGLVITLIIHWHRRT